MVKAGLVSITFRQLSPAEIVDLVSTSGLSAIEWGGDIHVPHGDLHAAREVYRMTRQAGLRVAAYGSYYCVGSESGISFDAVLETAAELHAPTIRIWAGDRASAQADEAYWNTIVLESRRIGDMAAALGITVSFEFHGDTLTDTNASAARLLASIDHRAVKAYWQPPVGKEPEYRLDGLRTVLPWLTNVHVFSWESDLTRRMLAEGQAEWQTYLSELASDGKDHFALMEFVKDDDPAMFLQDAAILASWLCPSSCA